MAQFDVFENNNDATKEFFPYMLDVQHSLHERLDTRMVIPLTKKLKPMRGLHPTFRIKEEEFVAIVPEMGGIPTQYLGKRVGNLSKNSGEIINAIDFLITGF